MLHPLIWGFFPFCAHDQGGAGFDGAPGAEAVEVFSYWEGISHVVRKWTIQFYSFVCWCAWNVFALLTKTLDKSLLTSSSSSPSLSSSSPASSSLSLSSSLSVFVPEVSSYSSPAELNTETWDDGTKYQNSDRHNTEIHKYKDEYKFKIMDKNS